VDHQCISKKLPSKLKTSGKHDVSTRTLSVRERNVSSEKEKKRNASSGKEKKRNASSEKEKKTNASSEKEKKRDASSREKSRSSIGKTLSLLVQGM
jgi:hypothetical protein